MILHKDVYRTPDGALTFTQSAGAVLVARKGRLPEAAAERLGLKDMVASQASAPAEPEAEPVPTFADKDGNPIAIGFSAPEPQPEAEPEAAPAPSRPLRAGDFKRHVAPGGVSTPAPKPEPVAPTDGDATPNLDSKEPA